MTRRAARALRGKPATRSKVARLRNRSNRQNEITIFSRREIKASQSAQHDERDRTLAPYDIFLFPVIEWNRCFQRPQHLSLQFARSGHRVYYFSIEFFAEHCLCEMGANPVADGVYWVRLPGGAAPPDMYRDIPSEVHLAAMENGIRKLRRDQKIGFTVSIVNYPFWQPLVRRICNNITVYDCIDDYASFANAGRPAHELESALMTEADLVVCSSEHLRNRARASGHESILVRNAVDPHHFASAPEKLAMEPNVRTAGYWGVIAEWTDLDLLVFAARALPDIRFVLIGEILRIDPSPLRKLPNVVMIPEVDYKQLPSYLHVFDVCLLPYRVCDRVLASDPVKVWEYMSAGKPVVAVRFPEIERLNGLITLASTREEFVAGIRAALESKDPGREQKVKDFASENTWSRRGERLMQALEP